MEETRNETLDWDWSVENTGAIGSKGICNPAPNRSKGISSDGLEKCEKHGKTCGMRLEHLSNISGPLERDDSLEKGRQAVQKGLDHATQRSG